MEETTIDLRPFFETPLHWWRLIAGITLIAILFTSVRNISIFTPERYQAASGVAIVKSRTQVTFDTSARTLDEDQLQQLQAGGQSAIATDAAVRRQTLVGIVNNGAIAENVAKRLGDELTEEERRPGALNRMVSAELGGSGQEQSDLIRIIVEHPDPLKASKIANAWAEEYEQLVNDIYGRPPEASSTLLEDLEKARDEYDQSQEALTAFLEESHINQARRQLTEKTKILALLHSARQKAISTTLNAEIDAKAQIYQAYLKAEAENHLLAVEGEQQRKRDLVDAYIQADSKARVSLFENQAKERQRLFDDAYRAKAINDNLLRRARALQEQAAQGGDAKSTALALALLKAEVAGVYPFQNTFELRLEDTSSLTAEDLKKDTEALVKALEEQRDEIDETIEKQRQVLLAGDGLTTEQPITDTVVSTLIHDTYPTLFQTDDLIAMSRSASANTPIATSALSIADSILQMRDRQELLDLSSKESPLSDVISSLEQEVRDLEAQIERDTSRREMLRHARDLALNTYTTLSRKAAEFKVADQLPGTEVRLAARAPVPTVPVSVREKRLNLAIAGFLGLIIGLLGAFWLEYLGPDSPPKHLFGRPDAIWNRAFRWMMTRYEIPQRSAEERNQSQSASADPPHIDKPPQDSDSTGDSTQ
jgi:capsular polysaccharide biosynthesis protein